MHKGKNQKRGRKRDEPAETHTIAGFSTFLQEISFNHVSEMIKEICKSKAGSHIET